MADGGASAARPSERIGRLTTDGCPFVAGQTAGSRGRGFVDVSDSGGALARLPSQNVPGRGMTPRPGVIDFGC